MPYHFSEIDSTQAFLKKLVLSEPGLSHLEYVVSEMQTGGVGRHGRSWISENGNLFLSLYVKEFSLPLTWIPHWIGVSLFHALTSLQVPESALRLKWPNDLVVNETQKAGGILCEKIGDGIVVGIGVNLVSAPDLSDRETANIKMLMPAHDFSGFPMKLCETILEKLKTEPTLLELRQEYQKHSLLVSGRAIEWIDLQTKISGKGNFLRYGEFGELIVDDGNQQKALYSEEVKLVL